MTEEEKEAIERLSKAQDDIWYATLYSQEEQDKDIVTILNLIEKQNKIIDLMAEQLTTPVNGKEWVIKYYEREVEENANSSKT